MVIMPSCRILNLDALFLTKANGKSRIGLLVSGMPMMHPAIARVKGISLALNSLSDVSQDLVCRLQSKFRDSIS